MAFFYTHFRRRLAMKLTEAEMRMVFQIESTNQNAALNEIYMTWRYAPNPAAKETAEGLLDKFRPVGSGVHEFDPQGAGRIPPAGESPHHGEMLAEARQQSGAQKLSGHDIMALERFEPATRHMIVFDVLTHDSPVGWKGEKNAPVPDRHRIQQGFGKSGKGAHQNL